MSRKIELLSPARTAEIGKAAIIHGADAVYIGAPDFGARHAACNSLEDIAELCRFAHIYSARVYVTLNTLIYEDEIERFSRLAFDLYDAGVDAFIVQDLSALRIEMPPVPLHASTQMDNRTPEKFLALAKLGYEQAVLARELSLDEIKNVSQALEKAGSSMQLEAFVHGALCVSYSGQCRASEHCFKRSANRGDCAQFCRMAFDLLDEDGRELAHQRYLLSLNDLNRSTYLEQMLDAGVTSFKIEGRLKDMTYVKNVTAYYRQRLDEIFARRSEYEAASCGTVRFNFTPDLERSFHRNYTNYFIDGKRAKSLVNLATPKAMGQYVGTWGHLAEKLSNGDGLCYINGEGQLHGFRVNRVEGERIFPAPGSVVPMDGTPVYRNQDVAFEALLARNDSAERKIPLDITLTDADFPVSEYELARNPQEENIRKQLSKLGGTPFALRNLNIEFTQNWFIPSSHLSAFRRELVEKTIKDLCLRHADSNLVKSSELDKMDAFTDEWGGGSANRFNPLPQAYETVSDRSGSQLIMTCRYCIKHELGLCKRNTGPLRLRLADGREFQLKFDCNKCQMQIFTTER